MLLSLSEQKREREGIELGGLPSFSFSSSGENSSSNNFSFHDLVSNIEQRDSEQS